MDHQKPVGKKDANQITASGFKGEVQAILLHVSYTVLTCAVGTVTSQSFSPLFSKGFSLRHICRITGFAPKSFREYPMLMLKLSTCAIAQTRTGTVITQTLLVVVDRVIATTLVATVMAHRERITGWGRLTLVARCHGLFTVLAIYCQVNLGGSRLASHSLTGCSTRQKG